MSVLTVTLGGLHPLTPILLRSILWGQPDDPENRYPLQGNLQYVYMEDDYQTICLLLREGPKSPSKEKKAVIQQIKSHETLIAFKVVNNYPSYVVAKFKPIEYSYATEMESGALLKYTMDRLETLDKKAVEMAPKLDKQCYSLLKNPLDIFKKEILDMKLGIFSEDLLQVVEGLKSSLQSYKVESDLEDMVKAAGISDFGRDRMKVIGILPGGIVEDITDELKDENN